jgi:hypothetical protein
VLRPVAQKVKSAIELASSSAVYVRSSPVKRFPRFIAVFVAALLTGCATTTYQPVESRKPIVDQGEYGTSKVVDGMDVIAR